MANPRSGANEHRLGLIVLGMHRSGTSLASGLLSHAGVYFGEPADFITPNEENPKGFWERRDVRALNDRLLHSVGCDWSEIASFADSIVPPGVLDGFRGDARAIVENLQAGASSGVIGMKEPRLCLLLPHWLEVLGEQAFYVLVHRDPAEIALSLETRNGIPPEVAHYLTEVYLGNAIKLAQAGPCQIVSYSDLVHSPLEFIHSVVERLEGLDCHLGELNEEEIRDYPTLELHRSRVTKAGGQPGNRLGEWCRALEAGELPELSVDWPTPPAAVLRYEHRKRFDEFIRAERQREYIADRVSSLDSVAAGLTRRVEGLQAGLESSAKDLRDGRLRLQIAQARKEADRARIYELDNTAFQLKQDVISVERTIKAQAGQLASLQQELVTLTLQVGGLEQQRRTLTKELADLENTTTELAEISDQLAARLNALRGSLSWKLVRPALALSLNPLRLGFGRSILAEIAELLNQHAGWAASWRNHAQAKAIIRDNLPASVDPERAGKSLAAVSPEETAGRASLRPDELLEQLNSAGLKVGLAVTETDEASGAGDYYTASELAAALTAELGWQCTLLGRNDPGRDWYDVSGLDCLVVLLESYDLRKVRAAGRPVLTVAWIRNWTDQWVARPWFGLYDLVLCSSEVARQYISDRTGNNARVLRIAANTERFNPATEARPGLNSDYCFTGSYWGAPRRIEALQPADIPFEFALYGRGWQGHAQFSESWRGNLPYAEIPGVYRSTKILIDDANHVTAPWGSVNSRVFDALACGTLVLSNGREGIWELFGDRLPTWSTIADLKEQVVHFLNHPAEREALAKELREMVVTRHGYGNRADELRQILLGELAAKARVAIKLPFDSLDEALRHDEFHLARGLAAELRGLGYAVRLDLFPEWSLMRPLDDNAVLCFPGRNRYLPRAGERSLLWLMRCPGEPQPGMYEGYERILVASRPFSAQLAKGGNIPVTLFMCCADPQKYPFAGRAQRSRNIVFAGHAEEEIFPILKDAIEAGLAPLVLGQGWESFLDSSMIECEQVKDADLARIYPASGAVLCGHSPAERDSGFVGRRIFDILASGGVPITDDVNGIGPIFGDLVQVYDGSPEGLERATDQARFVNTASAEYEERVGSVVSAHSVRAAAVSLDTILSDLLGLEPH